VTGDLREAVAADEADEALMRKVQADDAVAFGVLYDRFSARAYRVAVGSPEPQPRRRHGAGGVVSLWRSRARYNPDYGTVTGWVMTTVRNRAIDVLRVQSRHDARRTSDHSVEERLTAADAVEEQVAERDRAARLRVALAALPAAQRDVITLAYFGELSATEIATRLSLPVGTVKGRMRLGLTKLRHRTDP
jgi:RNA polymerase sigma-70 factor (ECF subfamily)